MRLTKVLFRQNIGWHAKMKWRTQKRRNIQNEGAVDNLRAMGLPVTDPLEELIPDSSIPPLPAEFVEPTKIFDHPRNETHPWWNSRTCHIFGDSNVLIYGQKQAQVLTKTLQVNELPKSIEKLSKNVDISNETDIQFKNSILQAHLFDTHQEKLKIRKHPVKKMWVYPRDYGLTDQRKNRYITEKILHLCEKLSDISITSQRKILENAAFVVPFEKDGDLIQFQKTAESFVVAKQPLKSIDKIDNAEENLPDIYPLKSNISIDKENIYQMKNVFPIEKGANFEYPHTAFVHYTPLDVFNCTLEPVKEEQVASRALLKAFTIAASKAQSVYGADVRDLPKPVTVQCVQVHVNKFYFGVYQLNTLNLDGDGGIKNYWFNIPPQVLYTNCEYHESRPVLTNYNNDVLRHALAFYQNQ